MQVLNELNRSTFAAYNLLSIPVWLFDLDSLRILAANDAAVAWCGYPAMALAAMTVADLRPEEERQSFLAKLRTFRGGDMDAGAWTIVTKSGERRIASISWKLVSFEGSTAVVASIRDETRARRAEAQAAGLAVEVEALQADVRSTTEHIACLFNAIPGKMAVLTPGDHTIVAVTDEYAQAVFMKPEEMIGRRLFDLFPADPAEADPEGPRNLRTSLGRVEALRVADVMNVQRYPVRGADGVFRDRFWLPRNKPAFCRDGRLTHIIHRVEDVTHLVEGAGDAPGASLSPWADRDYMAAEAQAVLRALQEKATRLMTAEALLGIGSWDFDIETRAVSWSPRVFEIYGVPFDRPAPQFDEYIALVHPEDRPRMLAVYDELANSGAATIEFKHRIVRRDGSTAHIRGVGARHAVEGRQIVVGFVQDITGFVEAEAKLVESARLQRVAGAIARLGSWRVDMPGRAVTWSAQTARIHDWPAGEAPSLERCIEFYAPEDRRRARTLFQTCAARGHSYDDVFQIVTPKGRRAWVRVLGEAVYDDQGSIVAVEGACQDVSELIEARNMSAALSARLRQTLDTISDGFFLLDNEGRFSFINSEAEKLLQVPRSDLLGKRIWEEYPEASSGIFKERYEYAIANDHSVRFEEFFVPINSWLEVNAYPTSEGLAVYFRDVTAERARDEHIRLLEAAVARQNDILIITEADPVEGADGPKIVFVNDAFERRTGFTRDEVIGRTPRILQGPKTQRGELDRIRAALKRQTPIRAELINYTKAGEEFWLEVDIVPVGGRKGGVTHFVAIERDITERKLAEKALKASDERFHLIAKATNDVVWDWDRVTGDLWWNASLTSLFGYEPGDMSVGGIDWIDNIHPDDRARVEASIDAFIEGPGTVWQEEYRFLHKNGSPLTVIDRAFAIRNSEGVAVRLLGSMLDVTGQREMERRLRQSQKLEAIGQMTGGVAHDFNNLLTVILGNAEILSEESPEGSRMNRLTTMIVNAAGRGAELTSRLLAFSRQQALEPKVLDASRLVRGMEELLRRSAPENVDIEIVSSAGLWKTEVDPGQLESALLNLAFNARDAMPDGGAMTIELANVVLDDSYVHGDPEITPGRYVMIAVTDTGCGMPPDVLSRIFEPFFTTKDVGKGSGLGLSMVYGFVKQSGGHIRAYSEPGEGTVVKLYFPRSYAGDEPARFQLSDASIVGGRETILVVEDDDLVRQHVTGQLSGLGYNVLEASSGRAAIDVVRDAPALDLLFTDVVMPGGVGGRELAEMAVAIRPALKVLFTSGYPENSVVHHGRLDPGVNLLSKPYRREQLAMKIRKALDEGAP